jgi:hypothetical protein
VKSENHTIADGATASPARKIVMSERKLYAAARFHRAFDGGK